MIHENIQDLHVFWCPIKSHHISLVVIKPVLIPFYMNPIKIIVQYQNFGLLIPLYMNPIIYIYISHYSTVHGGFLKWVHPQIIQHWRIWY